MKNPESLKKEEDELFILKEKYRSTIEMSFDAIVSVDRDGNITLWNRAAERIFGYTAEEALGRPVEMIVPPEHLEKHRQGLAAFSETGRGALIDSVTEVTGLKKDGTRVSVELSISAARINGWLATAVLRDISERKRLEGDLRERLEETERLNRLMVGREMKMEEMRREIERLRSLVRGREKADKG